MTARERILGRIRTAIAGQTPPPLPAPCGRGDLDDGDRAARFCERLTAVGGRVVVAATPAVATAAIVDALQRAEAKTVALGAGAELEAVAHALAAAGCRCLPPSTPSDAVFAADAGVTTAQFGIAETGSIALLADAGPSRVASLVPPLHIALLPRARLLRDLDELFAGIAAPLPHALTIITGPSRTADIELQLVIGVHGPRDLLVVLVDGDRC